MSAHTPGPWTLSTVATSCGSCHKIGPFPGAGSRPEVHACVYADGIRIGMDEKLPAAQELLANARVMAAAPDGLAFARSFVANIDEWDGEPSPGQRWHKEYIAAKALIAKATGEKP